MQQNHKPDLAFNTLMSNMLDKSSQYLDLNETPINDQHEQLLALQRRFALQPPAPFAPGHIVQWKPGMKNRSVPAYGEPAIVTEVLSPPILLASPELDGSNMFREPLSIVLGLIDKDGDFLLFHFDARRFELMATQGEVA